jgi:magnesium transporter
MTVHTVLKRDDPAFVWLDVVQPTPEELAEIAQKYDLQPTSVSDCLDPEHLPKFEQFDNYTFVILRAWDELADNVCATVQEMTRKLAIFSGSSFLITIHRKDQPWLTAIESRFDGSRSSGQGKEGRQAWMLAKLVNGAVDTYLKPMEAIETRLDQFEEAVFAGREVQGQHFAASLREVHVLKRQVTLIKRLLWRTQDVVQRMTPASGRSVTLFRDAQENVESVHFYADELLDDANTLLSVQLALASHRTGEVMRVLTVFSVFFLPLTFIVGIYGMNFQFMPELKHRWGYPGVMVLMGMVTLIIYLWFRRRGWLRQ